MARYDVLIKGGTVVDGTMVPKFRADVGIAGGRIVEIGRIKSDDAERVLDADGLVVAPGFVDLHTHYDAQIQWDPYCSISGWHGVTSVALGNCGFGFAPVRPDERDRAMLSMSRNEAIPLESLRAGLLWDWETFPEYMDTLDRIPKGVNCLTYVPLSPLLIYGMGLDAAKSRPATPEEQARMTKLLGEAMDAGACGWSAQRIGERSIQADYDGTPMVTDTMSDDDVFAFARALGERGEGIIQITQAQALSDGDVERDLAVTEKIAELAGVPVLYNVVLTVEGRPQVHKRMIEWLRSCNERGLPIYGQGNTIRAPFVFSLADWNLFDSGPAWNRALVGTHAEKLQKLRDPELVRQMAADANSGMLATPILGGPIEGFLFQGAHGHPELDTWLGMTVGDIAKERGAHPVQALVELSLASDLRAEFLTRSATSSNPEYVGELLASPYVLPGVSDGGAHTKFLTAGSYATDTLMWLVRDEKRLTLEEAHYKLSYLPARAAGFRDRGFLREGAPADVVVYELERLARLPEWWDSEVVHDFPAGEWRRVQRADGYRYTLVNGAITFEDGRCTGATPGRLLRGGRAAA
ncbi:MAG: amidohydrolase family protein [Myxococcota bacterium]